MKLLPELRQMVNVTCFCDQKQLLLCCSLAGDRGNRQDSPNTRLRSHGQRSDLRQGQGGDENVLCQSAAARAPSKESHSNLTTSCIHSRTEQDPGTGTTLRKTDL